MLEYGGGKNHQFKYSDVLYYVHADTLFKAHVKTQ